MHGFIILMFIFGVAVLLAGYYLYSGHDASFLTWRAPYLNATKEDFKRIGKGTMITSLSPILTGIIAIFVEENSVIPIIFLGVSLIGIPIIASKFISKK